MAAASLIAVEFITPQPQMNVQSGLNWRASCSQVDFCSSPGAATGYISSWKPCRLASSWNTGIGSLPYGES